jgi:hypothetical protein
MEGKRESWNQEEYPKPEACSLSSAMSFKRHNVIKFYDELQEALKTSDTSQH